MGCISADATRGSTPAPRAPLPFAMPHRWPRSRRTPTLSGAPPSARCASHSAAPRRRRRPNTRSSCCRRVAASFSLATTSRCLTRWRPPPRPARCARPPRVKLRRAEAVACCRVLPHASTCYHVLPPAATCCHMLPHTTTCRHVPPRAATLPRAVAQVRVFRIDGSVPVSERQALVTTFQALPEDEPAVFVLSILAAGQGLTLTAASTVVFGELRWVPGELLQAADGHLRLLVVTGGYWWLLVVTGVYGGHRLLLTANYGYRPLPTVTDRYRPLPIGCRSSSCRRRTARTGSGSRAPSTSTTWSPVKPSTTQCGECYSAR